MGFRKNCWLALGQIDCQGSYAEFLLKLDGWLGCKINVSALLLSSQAYCSLEKWRQVTALL
jgi:hypothetical protein